jgi:hypothetical protein
MIKILIALITVLFSAHCLSANCKDVVDKQLNSQVSAAHLFPTKHAHFSVIICSEQPNPFFDVFDAILHSKKSASINPSLGALTRIKQPINPNGKSRSTGVIVSENSAANQFTVKLRVRLDSGEAIDISKTITLVEGALITYLDKNMLVGVARLTTK